MNSHASKVTISLTRSAGLTNLTMRRVCYIRRFACYQDCWKRLNEFR